MRLSKIVWLACAALLALEGTSRASWLYTGTGLGASSNYSASAEFIWDGVNTLDIILTNTSTMPGTGGASVLTGLLFNTGNSLTPVSAQLTAGGTVVYSPASPVDSNNPGSGWGFGPQTAGYTDVNVAISASGVLLPDSGSSYFNPGGNLQGLSSGPVGKAPGYGILASGQILNSGMQSKGPYFSPSLIFRLTGFTQADLSDTVIFQFGTSTSELHFDGSPTPVPSALVLLLSGVPCAFGAYLRRRQTQAAA